MRTKNSNQMTNTSKETIKFLSKCLGLAESELLNLYLSEVQFLWNHIGLPQISINLRTKRKVIPFVELG